MNHFYKAGVILASIIISLFQGKPSSAQTPGPTGQAKQVLLSNGWKLSPAGTALTLGDLPLNLRVSPSGKYAAVTNNGQSTQTVQLIDPKNQKLLDTKVVGKSWYGLAFSHDEKHLYASGGYDNIILDFRIADNQLSVPDTIRLGQPWPKGRICPTGIAISKNDRILYTVTKEDSRIYTIDLKSKKVTDSVSLPGIAYSCVLSPDQKKLYVSLWGKNHVVVFNTTEKKDNQRDQNG